MDIQTLTMFFIWCTIINGSLLIFLSITYLLASDFIYRMHEKYFPMPRETFNVLFYSFLGLFKIIFLFFNIAPCAALIIIG